MPERIQQRRTKGWRKPEGAISVARPSRWGNPFRVGEKRMLFIELGWGVATNREVGPVDSGEVATVVTIEDRAQAVEWFRAWMKSCLVSASPPDLSVLTGHDLMCFCPLDQPCHADVLLELANPKEFPGV